MHRSFYADEALGNSYWTFLSEELPGLVHLSVTTDFGPGDHDWAYWDARIQDVLAWLQVVRR